MENNINKKELYDLEHQKKKAMFQSANRKRIARRVALWLSVAVLLTGSVFAISRFSDTSTVIDTNATIAAIGVTDQIKGDPQAKAIFIEYSDFQCPACAAYYPLVKNLIEKYGTSIVFVYRHFPLQQHPAAKPAAYAAEAAGKQGKFWEMHDLLFERQQQWSGKNDPEKIFRGYAAELGLSLEQYDQDVDSSDIKGKVESDIRSGQQAKITGTPTFFLNGKSIQPQSVEEFDSLIKNAIQ